MVNPCFSANEDVWVGYGDAIAKFGCFVFDTLEIDIDDFDRFNCELVFALLLWVERPVCCWWDIHVLMSCEENGLLIEVGELGRLVVS